MFGFGASVGQPSGEFIAGVKQAEIMARSAPDDAVRYLAGNNPMGQAQIPLYAMYRPTAEMTEAGSAQGRVLLGLWVADWPGYRWNIHGSIFLYEEGIRLAGGDLIEEIYRVLVHEYGHALQRDHVLDAMERIRAVMAAGQLAPARRGGCNCGR